MVSKQDWLQNSSQMGLIKGELLNQEDALNSYHISFVICNDPIKIYDFSYKIIKHIYLFLLFYSFKYAEYRYILYRFGIRIT